MSDLKNAVNAIDENIGPTAPPIGETGPLSFDDYFATIDEKNLIEQTQGALNEYAEMIRDLVINQGRIDILEEEVLGYSLEWFHKKILASQESIKTGKQLTLAFRGV